MELVNTTRLAAFAFRQYDMDGNLDVVLAVRGLFEHRQDQSMVYSKTPAELQWADQYEDDPDISPLLAQSDLIPEKPGTDVTFLGESHAPEAGLAEWSCGLSLGPVDKSVAVTGPRRWVRRAQGRFDRSAATWIITDAEKAENVPMDWRLTAGGPRIGANGPGERTEEMINPLGLGWPDHDAPAETYPAPQIADGVDSSSARPTGLAPIPSFWPDRSQYAGTYDKVWQDTRHPLLPHDFDPRFWHCAPHDQIVTPHLQGDESYTLTNLHPDHPVARGRLPDVELAVYHEDARAPDRADWHVLKLDGVHFDWRKTDQVALTWRVRFPLPDAQTATLTLNRVTLVAAADAEEAVA